MGNSNVLDDVFENFVNGAKLFKDREVLRHDYLPEKLPHREDQIRLLGATVAPVLERFTVLKHFHLWKNWNRKNSCNKICLKPFRVQSKRIWCTSKILLH